MEVTVIALPIIALLILLGVGIIGLLIMAAIKAPKVFWSVVGVGLVLILIVIPTFWLVKPQPVPGRSPIIIGSDLPRVAVPEAVAPPMMKTYFMFLTVPLVILVLALLVLAAVKAPKVFLSLLGGGVVIGGMAILWLFVAKDVQRDVSMVEHVPREVPMSSRPNPPRKIVVTIPEKPIEPTANNAADKNPDEEPAKTAVEEPKNENSKPSWLESTTWDNRDLLITIRSELFPSTGEASDHLDRHYAELVREKLQPYLQTGRPFNDSHYPLLLSPSLITDRYTEQHETSQGTWYREHARLRVSESVLASIENRQQSSLVEERVFIIGGVTMLFSTLCGVMYLFLRKVQPATL